MSEPDVVIRVEGLGKKYSLHHEKSERYTALRDVLARQAKATGRLLNPFTLAGQLRKAQRQAGQEKTASEEEFWALKDVNFEIRQGERVGIIGRNGAGKSTLLKILSRITEPTTGRVEIRGRVASLLEVGTGFHPELTGRENIYLNGAILGMTRREIRSRFNEIVDFAEVEKFLDTPVKRYSSGMYVRLAFAVAAHLEPEILVVDEVLAVGDASFQKKCLGKMQDVADSEGRTILYVSHNLPSVLALCHQAIFLRDGVLVDNGPSHSVVETYLASGAERSGAVQWADPATAPGNQRLLLRGVRVTSEGKIQSEVRIDRDVFVEIDYQVLVDGIAPHVAIHLFDRHGTCIFASSNSTRDSMKSDRWAGAPHHSGFFQSRVRIPANYLNEGVFRVTVIASTDSYKADAKVDEALTFTVEDTGKMRGDFTGTWIGVVRPTLVWATQPLHRETLASQKKLID